MPGWFSAKQFFILLTAMSCLLIVGIIGALWYALNGLAIALSIIFIWIMVATMPAVILFRRQWDREQRAKNNQCIDCGYNLAGNRSGVCPECGRKIAMR